MYNERELDAVLATDFKAFLEMSFESVSSGGRFKDNWHLDAIAWELDKVSDGDVKRLIVTIPPRHLKSITISVAWVAWMLGRDPSKTFVCVSYSNELAAKHARDCRRIMQSNWYQRVFPGTVLSRIAEHDFETTKKGGRLSTSVGGTLTGRGGDIIIIDDPIKPDEAMSEVARDNAKERYSNTLVSRLNDKNEGAIVLVMQRLHEDDLAGYLLEQDSGWRHLNLPAIAETDQTIEIGPGVTHRRAVGDVLHPAREDLERLDAMKREMGSAVFSAQYQQAPVPAAGLMVKKEWLKRYNTLPDPNEGGMIVQSWDTASKDGILNDWSVCITALVRSQTVYVLDVYRARLEFPQLLQKTKELASRYNARTILVEDAASGQQLIPMLRETRPRGMPTPTKQKVVTDKVTRMAGQSSRIEAGDLLLPKDAPWLDLFERELLGFPSARHDDQVDALAQLLAWVGTRYRNPDRGAGGGLLVEGRGYPLSSRSGLTPNAPAMRASTVMVGLRTPRSMPLI